MGWSGKASMMSIGPSQVKIEGKNVLEEETASAETGGLNGFGLFQGERGGGLGIVGGAVWHGV